MSQNTTPNAGSPNVQAESRAAMIAGGIIAVLGLLAVLFPFVTSLSLSILLGAVLVVGAIVHVAHAFSPASIWGAIWQVLLAIVYGFAGISLLSNPVLGVTTLTLLVIAYLVVDGVVKLGWAVVGRGRSSWLALLVSGALSLALAGLLWVGFPSTAVWAIGVLFGVNLIATGVVLILVGLSTRGPAREQVVTGEREQGV
ncbi:HdeD family acid-resistance protein [Halorarius halobius]|uniref:HdeD family acid-resistance protein n=1 Tax=Halorarius halobius TaxID=2962671 RepID=UPI0020CC5396|nr:DUF308 domain-containing protein [Halorarius halobius]